jgi:hypothetical protein
MEQICASEYAGKAVGSSLSGEPSHEAAFSKESEKVVYDLSGANTATEKTEWNCRACLKNFATKQSLQRHKEKFIVCRDWKEETHQLTESAYTWAIGLLETAFAKDGEGIHCRYCEKEFSNVGNLHKHFNTATACNHLAYKRIKALFSE